METIPFLKAFMVSLRKSPGFSASVIISIVPLAQPRWSLLEHIAFEKQTAS
jgi:hypothetical protein